MEPQTFLGERVTLHAGDCLDVIRGFADGRFDSVVTDPPYALVSIVKRFGKAGAKPTRDGDVYSRASAGFMGKAWDTGERAFAVEFWEQVLRVLKPGGHVVAFAGTRTYHRLAVAIEDAGFEIRDQIGWLYGSGFPKSHNQKGDWEGWGTALKPAWEPMVLARKPLDGTVAVNILQHGTGGINIDECRVGTNGGTKGCDAGPSNGILGHGLNGSSGKPVIGLGRWPANIVHDGSDEVVAAFPDNLTSGTGAVKRESASNAKGNSGAAYGAESRPSGAAMISHGDSGSAARFFYSAKADAHDRVGSKHPTVKPVDLMQWLVRLVTPNGGLVLDPFAGTGTTGEAAWREGMRAVLVEREEEYRADISRRMRLADSPSARAAAVAAARPRPTPSAPSLFDVLDAPPLAPALDVNDQP